MSNTLEELRIQAGINKTIVQGFQNSNTEIITYSADTQALATLIKLVVEKTLGHTEFLIDIEPDFSKIRKEVAHCFGFNGGIIMNEEMITKLKKLAANDTWFEDDDFNPRDFSGGNFDDAYYGGRNDGRVDLARDILTSMNIEWWA